MFSVYIVCAKFTFPCDRNGKLNIASLYLHRILRLIPLLSGTILFLVSIFRFMGDGPVWFNVMSSYRTNCENYWWSTLLHIQNYYNTNQSSHSLVCTYYDIHIPINGQTISIFFQCIPQSWYLAADFQLFLIAPFYVYLLRRYEWKTIPFMLLLILINILALIFSWPLDASNPYAQKIQWQITTKLDLNFSSFQDKSDGF